MTHQEIDQALGQALRERSEARRLLARLQLNAREYIAELSIAAGFLGCAFKEGPFPEQVFGELPAAATLQSLMEQIEITRKRISDLSKLLADA